MGTMQFDTESMEELKNQLAQSFSASQSDSVFTFKRHQGISGRIKDIVCALSLCHNVYITTQLLNFYSPLGDTHSRRKWCSFPSGGLA